MIPDRISIAEACEIADVDDRLIKRLIADGKILAFKPGCKYQIVKHSFEKWFLSTQVKPKGLRK